MSKKLFLIFGTIFTIALIGVAIQLYFRDSQEKVADPSSPEHNNASDVQEPQNSNIVSNNVDAGKIISIVQGPVFAPGLSTDGTKAVYFQDNKVYSIDLNGVSKNSIGMFSNGEIKAAEWNVLKNKALVMTSQGKFIYSLDSDQTIPLKESVDVATWSSKGDSLVYKTFDPVAKVRNIEVSDANNENWKIIKTINLQKVDFQINPKNGEVFYYPVPDNMTESILEGVGFDGTNQRIIFQGKFGGDYLWSPNGEKLLVSHTIEKGGSKITLGVINANGGEFRGLEFPTLVKKCVWSKDSVTVFCAFMNMDSENAMLPNDWQAGNATSNDTFWRIDTTSGKKTRLIEAKEITQSIDSTDLFLDRNEEYLFFLDRNTKNLYRLQL
jgi:hypothetical protein